MAKPKPDPAVGQRIAEARRSCQMTETELAEQLGVNGEAVRRWQMGKATPERAMIERCATRSC